MSMKLTDLMKLKGKKIEGRMGGAAPDRFGKGAAEVVDKKEQRRRDQEAGLVPFAVKLHGDLIKRLHALAQARQVSLNELTAELINAGLGNTPAAAAAPAAEPASEAKPEPAKKAAPKKSAAKDAAKPAATPEAEPKPKAESKPTAKKPAAKK
ncbi:MAG: hypothetical protein SF172_16455 [Burkholderiales bacterium]|nr:hypothetical protein [Burkholderiales bacterium]